VLNQEKVEAHMVQMAYFQGFSPPVEGQQVDL